MAVNDREYSDDPRIAAVYREASAEEPSRALDSAVLRNAREALAPVSGAPRSAWWMPWRVPVAFAAVAVLSVSIGLVVEREGGEPLRLEAPPAPPPAAPAPPPAALPQSEVVQSQATQSAAGASAAAKREPPRDEAAALAEREAEEAARAQRREATDAAVQQKRSEARERALLRDSAPTAQSKAAAGRAAEADAVPTAPPAAAPAPSATPMVAPPPPPAASERASAMEALPAAPDSAPKPFAAPPPAAKPRAAPAPKPLAAERRAAKPDPRDSALAAIVIELEQRPPAEWRERIAALRREGRADDADALAVEYRRRFPGEAPPPER